MAAVIAASRAEPTPDIYATWSTVGHTLDWADFTEYSTPGSNGFNVLELLGVAHGDNIADIGTLCREEFESYVDDWMVTNAMGVQSRAKPGIRGKAKNAGHAMRLACGTEGTYASLASDAEKFAEHQAQIAILTAEAATIQANVALTAAAPQ